MTETVQPQEILSPESLHAVFVDDEPIIREMTPAMLQGRFDSIEVFETPEEVIARFRKEDPPNVLITDGNLGEGKMTGLELARLTKDEFPTTTTVLISGGIPDINLDDKEILDKHGIDFYLPKPARLAQMRELPNNIRTLRQQQKAGENLPPVK